ncbi:MAG TPA: hypothetical protein VE732_01640, partial [Nitrososphaera sp.]|nr:hypothetical protein [Nitrososphaera sp.]
MHIVNAAVNLPGSLDKRIKSRASARFEMSPYFVGGPVTGWADSYLYKKHISLAAAAAISAAAINPQSGKKIPGWANWILLLTNFRLGVWLPNPRFAKDSGRFGGLLSFAPLDMLKELLGTNSEEDTTVFVSDGGHEDNLGITALVERGCRFITAVDAAADSRWKFEDLEYALSLLKERGWSLTKFELEGITPQFPWGDSRNRLSKQAVGEIELVSKAGVPTTLLIVKACLTENMIDLLHDEAQHYAKQHKNFPQESTADQWY